MSPFSPAPTRLRTCFENAVGRLLEHPVERYTQIEYRTGPRQAGELQAFLNQAGELLAQRGWDMLRHHEGSLGALSPEEITVITAYWATQKHSSTDLYGALLLPHEVFAQLSYRGAGSTMRSLASYIKSERHLAVPAFG